MFGGGILPGGMFIGGCMFGGDILPGGMFIGGIFIGGCMFGGGILPGGMFIAIGSCCGFWGSGGGFCACIFSCSSSFTR